MGITVNCEYPTPHQRDYKQPRERKEKSQDIKVKNALPIFINSLQTHSAEVISWSWKNNLSHSTIPLPHSPSKLQILGAPRDSHSKVKKRSIL